MKRNLSVVLIAMALLAGCSRVGSRPDAQVASDVQNKINGDSSIPDKQLNINANNGVITLTGTVASDAARNAAANDAAQIEGVKTVVNNLEVAPASAANQTAQPQEQANNNPPPPVREEARPSPSTHYRSSRSSSRKSASNSGGDTGLRTTVPSGSSTETPAAAEIRAAAMTRHNRVLRRLQRRCRYRRKLQCHLELS